MRADELYGLAQEAAARWRGQPGVVVADVTQEVTAALLEAAAMPRPSVLDGRGYFARVAQRAAQVYVWTLTAPVRLSSDPLTLRRSLVALRKAGTVPAEDVLPTRPVDAAPADVRLDGLRWARAVRQRVHEALAPEERDLGGAARRVLLEDASAAEVAHEHGADAKAIYVVTARVKRRILRDARVRALCRELGSRGE